MTAKRTRANGEGSIFPYRSGFAAYVWVTKPDGKRTRKYVYGKTREDVHDKWIKLHAQAKAGPVATKVPRLGEYVTGWLEEVVRPNVAPLTYATYETFTRLYIIPGLGPARLDRLQVRDVQTWLNKIRETCQCCAQGKDAARPAAKRRCCALGRCCQDTLSGRSISDIRAVLRSALSSAITEDLITKNVAAAVKLPTARSRKRKAWSGDEARRFLESARADDDPFYAAYVLVLVLGLRKGEVLGLAWDDVDLDSAELAIGWQVQRVRRKLLRRETKTEGSDATLPLPAICVTALRHRQVRQQRAKATAGNSWQDSGLVFTTRYGTPIEPRNFNRSYDRRIAKAGVRDITVHDARRTCGTLLADLDVHPRVAMTILRHAQFSITMEIYTQVSSEATRAALKKLGESLDG
ncbi:tyrosine-type recombinase/integrase [Planosporangium mesophilum]|uniref:Site-specific integrase n=1 Tax=Planosporangium mesophilum TaxID=689768 RepID=A0A8J3TF05_9ACTN|nr:site-specific integrase [Planosporangium mesophilum]NJC85157.1 site-specific integrase [Planosporangium mesophilum]GII24301.1 site-specific integrase [Planosporangium mesophilum]